MKFALISFLLFFNTILIQSQILDFKEKFKLPQDVKETSGLLFLNDKIITHNDSGDAPNLYEIDSLTGNLLRTINIANATNIDWEDITEDNDNIYIGDIGNNNGNRTDLKIYKVLKSDYLSNNSVSAEIISFSYEDQTDFSAKPNNNNFDAEAIVVFNNSIFLFTKNWADLKTNVYKIPLASGNYTATKVSEANVGGLISGAVYNNDRFFLTGYNLSLTPFLIHIDFNRKPGDDIFFSGFNKISLEGKLEQGSQIEAITNISFTGKYYISREFLMINQGENQFTFQQKLYEFYDERSPLLSSKNFKNDRIKLFSNLIKDKIKFSTTLVVKEIEIFSSLGKTVYFSKIKQQKQVDISFLKKGLYFLKFKTSSSKIITKRVIKL